MSVAKLTGVKEASGAELRERPIDRGPRNTTFGSPGRLVELVGIEVAVETQRGGDDGGARCRVPQVLPLEKRGGAFKHGRGDAR